jgi:DNA-binding response OmpR family regulator
VNGFEVIRQLKDRLGPARWHINQTAKIIVVTGRGEQETADFTRKLGADAYLVKPVDPVQLLSTVRSVLSA